jgi:MSHA biogenesis protein MshI
MAERQQINLYQPAADLSRRPFSARAAALTVGAVLAAQLGIWGYGSWQVTQVQRSVSALEELQRRQEDRVNAAGLMHAARANPEAIQAHIKEMTAALARRRRALELLRQGAQGSKVGFSAQLAGLARRHVDGLWIEHIVLSGSSRAMTLEGLALQSDLVPRYLRELARDPALSGARFDRLVIERPATPPEKIGLQSAAAAEQVVRATDEGPHGAPTDQSPQPAGMHRAVSRDSMHFRAESSAAVDTAQAGAAS